MPFCKAEDTGKEYVWEEIQSVWFEHAELVVLLGAQVEKSRKQLDRNAHLGFKREAWAGGIDLAAINTYDN